MKYRNASKILPDKLLREIYGSGVSMQELALTFNLYLETIRKIIHRK